MKTRIVVAAALAALSVLPSRSEAGINQGTTRPWCYKEADGSGSCGGTFTGFRATADVNAYAFVQSQINGLGPVTATFSAELNGVQYSCTAQDAPVIDALFHLAATQHYFAIQWDAFGICRWVQSVGNSQNPN